MPKRRALVPLLLALCATLPAAALARGYTPQGSCGDYARLDIQSPAGTCVALVADEAEGLRAPRRILEVAPGRYWLTDMGSWEPHHGRLLEMALPAAGAAPRRATFTVLADKLDRPHGLALGPDGKVYVGEAGTVWRAGVPAAGAQLQREPLLDHLPDDGAHPLKELAFGPDGALYINVGSSSDACRDDKQQQALPCGDLAGDKPRAAVYQALFDGPQRTLKSFKPFATGLRNSLALTVLPDGPAKGTVLQGENSIDYPEGNLPPEELNVLQAGKHYGWPYCTGNREAARGYEKRYDCTRSEAPLMLWPGHAAPLQMLAGPAGTPFAGQVLVAWHGYKPAGHRLVGYTLDARGLPAGKPVDWLAGWDKGANHPLGKPTGFTIDRQGRLLVVEDFNRTVLMLLPTGAAPKK